MESTNVNADQMSICSYNPTGWNTQKANMIKEFLLSKNIKICAIQEHFILPQNLHKIQEHFKNFKIFSLPAVKSNTQISRGRPSGGLAFIYSNTLSKCIERVSCPNSSRVHALKLNVHNVSYVLINSY